LFSKRKRLFAILAMVAVVAGAFAIAKSGIAIKYPVKSEEAAEESTYTNDKNTVRIWYTDDALTDYLNLIAVNYNEENEEYRVVTELVSGMEYLENISAASVSKADNMPDLYITTNDTLEKAHLAGLAEKINIPVDESLGDLFPETAVNAVTYDDETIAYPLYFESSALLYNNTYIYQWARNTLEAEKRSEVVEKQKEEEAANSNTEEAKKAAAEKKEAEAKMTDAQKEEAKKAEEEAAKEAEEQLAAEISAMVSDEDVQKLVDEYFPDSIDKLLAFSDAYDAPEGVDTIFKWAVNDIFYNYFFIGDAIDIGGIHGDNKEIINIYNEASIKGLQTYQDLNQFFSINTDDVSYSSVIQEFIDGSIVMTIATSDSYQMLKEAEAEGKIEFDYRFTLLPDIVEGVDSRSMSVTDVVAINGYSLNKEIANDFALYLCTQSGSTLYERAGKLSALKDAEYGDADEYLSVFKEEYEYSVPLPKIIETSNYWAELEMLFASVWDGEDANKGLKELSEQMKLQVTGEKITEEPIVIEEEVEQEDEIIETDTMDDESQ